LNGVFSTPAGGVVRPRVRGPRAVDFILEKLAAGETVEDIL